MILVTGGAGFIGSHLVESAVTRGLPVRVLDNLSSGHERNLEKVRGGVEFLRGSVTDPRIVHAALQGVRKVFHLGACASVVRSMEEPLTVHETNATGTLVMLEECARAGVERFIFASSSAVYGDRGLQAAREDDPTRPLSLYGSQKLLGENYCRSFAEARRLHTVSLRLFNVFGPRQDPGSPYSGVISVFSQRLLGGRTVEIHGDGGQERDFVYVDCVVDACWRAAEADVSRGSVFNVASGRSMTIAALYQALCRELGIDRPARHGATRAGDIRCSRADPTAAREALGLRGGISFEEGLRRTLAWYRAAPTEEAGP